MTTSDSARRVALGRFGEFLCRPQWVVLGGLLVAASGVFVIEFSMVAARTIDPNVLRRTPLVALPSYIAMIGGVLAVNVVRRHTVTTKALLLGRSVRLMRFLPFAIGVVSGLVLLEILDSTEPNLAIPTLRKEFTAGTLVVSQGLQFIVLASIFLVSNYSSAIVQLLRDLTDESVTNERRIRDLNRLLIAQHRETARSIAADLHGHLQGRLIRLALRMSNNDDIQEIREIVDSIVRPMAHRIYPAELGLSLGAALERLCGDSIAYAPTRRFEQLEQGGGTVIPLDLRESVYYVALEATTNALKHGIRGTCEVVLDADETAITLRIGNDDASQHQENPAIQLAGGSAGLALVDSEVDMAGGHWTLLRHHGRVEFSASFPFTHG